MGNRMESDGYASNYARLGRGFHAPHGQKWSEVRYRLGRRRSFQFKRILHRPRRFVAAEFDFVHLGRQRASIHGEAQEVIVGAGLAVKVLGGTRNLVRGGAAASAYDVHNAVMLVTLVVVHVAGDDQHGGPDRLLP